LAQLFALLVTLGISIFAGATGGLIASMSCFKPDKALFRDEDHIEEVTEKYPSEFLKDGDEKYNTL
jgi:PHP family Zn ribbon phosphoesterase